MKARAFLIPAIAVPVLALTTAASAPFPASSSLPNDFAPEGIAVGTGTTFYVGSMWDGDIYRGDLRTGLGKVFIDRFERDDAGHPFAIGLKPDERRHLLAVAGGFDGKAAFYDTRDGSVVADLQLGPADGSSLINDVIVTGDAAYFTDTLRFAVYRVPISPTGAIGQPQTLTVTGPAAGLDPEPAPQLGFNGIEATADGTLIVGNTSQGKVFTVDPATGLSAEIAVPPTDDGQPLPTNDGILLDGQSLWVVSNFTNTVFEVRLSRDLSSGEIINTITNDDVGGLFRVPTTVAQHGNKLVLVNGRFDKGFPPPFGDGAPVGTDYNVIQIDKP